MNGLHCCEKLIVNREETSVVADGIEFPVTIVYCKSCGSIKYGGTGIKDGKLLKENEMDYLSWMSPMRRSYHKIIQNLTNNADIFSRMYTETGDPAALKAYNHYVKEIKEIKEKIIESEKNDKVV